MIKNGSIISWNWDFGNKETSNEQSPVYIYPDIGEYNIILTVTDNTGHTNANTFLKKISIVKHPKAFYKARLLRIPMLNDSLSQVCLLKLFYLKSQPSIHRIWK